MKAGFQLEPVKTKKTDSESGDSSDSDNALADELLEEVYNALELKRAEVAADDDPRVTDFQVTVLGGEHTQTHHDKPFDACAGSCRGGDAKKFHTRRFGGIRFFRADYSAHGPAIPAVLARAWCHRMQFFFNKDAELGADAPFTDELIVTYQETSEFERLCEQNAGNATVMARVAQIRRIPLEY